jgi:hypothetical protein
LFPSRNSTAAAVLVTVDRNPATRSAGANALVAAIAFASLVLLWTDVSPEPKTEWLLPLAILLGFAIPIAVVGLAIWGITKLVRKPPKTLPRRFPRRQLVTISATVVGTALLLAFDVPLRAAFTISRAAFERALPSATRKRLSEVEAYPVHNPWSRDRIRPMGAFEVHDVIEDPRGGVFFCIAHGADGLGPDIMTYGFAYQPNRKGTPFGNARYGLRPLGQDWYVFHASDDY